MCAFLAFLVDIQEALREKSQSLRKHVQENESLEFRNHQLSKRVSLLQEEISSPTSKKKKKVKFSTCLSFCIAVLVVVMGTTFTWILFLPLHPHPPLSYLLPHSLQGQDGFVPGVSEIHTQELAAKISENERLHMKV